MVLDRVDDFTDEYVIQNTSFQHGGAVLRIPKTREYYASEDDMLQKDNGSGEFRFSGNNGEFMRLVNEDFGDTMKQNTWYLLPQAYSLTLVRGSPEISRNEKTVLSEQELVERFLLVRYFC